MKKNLAIKKHLTKIKVYALLVLMLFSALIPLKALAVDWNFFSSNDILFYNPTDCSNDNGGGGGLVDGGNQAKIWCYLVTHGISKNGAAGIMGNMGRETGGTFEPKLWQGGGVCIDKRSNLCGYGLVQWTWQTYKWDTSGSMKTLWEFAGEQFPNDSGKVGTLQTQLDYLLYTLQTSHASLLTTLEKPGPTVDEQEFNFYNGYEMSGLGSRGDANDTSGKRYALTAYSQHHNLPCSPSAATIPATTSSSTTTGGQTVVIIDPGHANTSPPKPDIDPAGLKDVNYPNSTPEMQDVFDVATLVKTKLSSDGYKALMTKDSVDSVPTSYERAKFADDNNGDIALSIHTDSGSWPSFNSGGQIYAQKTTGYREKPDGTQVKFTNSAVATKSQQYADKFLAARSIDENNVVITDANFNLRGSTIAKGNLPIVQLLSNVPWVYNEAGARPGLASNPNAGLTDNQKKQYADGLVKGVEDSIGPNAHQDSSGNDCNGNNPGSGGAASIVDWAVRMSFSDGGHGVTDAVPLYKQWFPKYFAWEGDNYSECNQFVATVMRASGADPNYSLGDVTAQLAYIISHPNKYEKVQNASLSTLLPGDIMIIPGHHTFIFVGDQTGGNIRSASEGGHGPEAGSLLYEGGGWVAYRLK